MKRKIITVALCMMLALSTLLISCDKDSGNEDLFATSGEKKTKATTVTTAPEEVDPVPTNLIPQIIDSNLAIGRLTKGVEVSIDEDTSVTLNYQGWPTICAGEGNTIYAVSSLRIAHVDPFGAICFYESHDGGETWSEPRIIIDTPLDDRDAGITYLGNNMLMVTWFTHDTPGYFENDDPTWTKWQDKVTPEQKQALTKKWAALPETEKKGKSFTMLSKDGGETWETPNLVPVTAPHGPTLMNDGRTLIYIGATKNPPAAGFTNLKGTNLYVIKSNDYGKTWRIEATLPKPEGGSFTFAEAHILQLRNGSFIAAARGQRTYENSDMRIWLSYSTDGRNWTDFEEFDGLVGGPPHFMETRSGVLIMSYSYRLSPTGSRARFSYDGGKTWSKEVTLCIADNSAVGDLGYPSTVELEDGTLVTAYYQRHGNDAFPSFLFTKWELVAPNT